MITNREIIEFIERHTAKRAPFFSVRYATEEGVTTRTIQLGADMVKAFCKRVGPPNGKGNWHSRRTGGKGEGTIYATCDRGRATHVRGIDAGDNGAKIFKLESIWGIACGGETLGRF